MPQFHSTAATEAAEGLNDFVKGYIEAIYFCDTGDSEQPGSEIEMSPASVQCAVEDCTAFQSVNAALLAEAYERAYDEVQAGRDFWFTRNGHGVGYWDRKELEDGDLGDKLTAAAKAFGERWSYEADDGMLHLA
jgi:hypothetical protein